MNSEEKKKFEELQKEVEELRENNRRLIEGSEQLMARNLMLSEKLEIYYEVRRHVEWLKDLVRRNRELMAQADLRDDEELLAMIEVKLESGEVKLTPEYGIAEVAELVGTTQTRIADLYRTKSIFHSVDKYLDFLRLMHALQMLKENPYYNIEAIASESGFNSVRTLQRKIQESIGLTPGQYRDLTNNS